jgi:hypothetical protein
MTKTTQEHRADCKQAWPLTVAEMRDMLAVFPPEALLMDYDDEGSYFYCLGMGTPVLIEGWWAVLEHRSKWRADEVVSSSYEVFASKRQYEARMEQVAENAACPTWLPVRLKLLATGRCPVVVLDGNENL